MTIQDFKITFLDKSIRLCKNIEFILVCLGLEAKQKFVNLEVKAEELDLNIFFSEASSLLSLIAEDAHILRLAFAYENEPCSEGVVDEMALPKMMDNLSFVESLSRRALNDLEIALTTMSDAKDESSDEQRSYSSTFEGRSEENLSILDECLECSNKILHFIDPVEKEEEE